MPWACIFQLCFYEASTQACVLCSLRAEPVWSFERAHGEVGGRRGGRGLFFYIMIMMVGLMLITPGPYGTKRLILSLLGLQLQAPSTDSHSPIRRFVHPPFWWNEYRKRNTKKSGPPNQIRTLRFVSSRGQFIPNKRKRRTASWSNDTFVSQHRDFSWTWFLESYRGVNYLLKQIKTDFRSHVHRMNA